MKKSPEHYRHRIAVDTEFRAPDGEAVEVVHCVVAIDEVTGNEWHLTPDDLAKLSTPPWPTGDDVLTIAWAASAEWGAYRRLGWKVPRSDVVDLFYEFRLWKNCRRLPPPPPGASQNGILNACYQFGIPATESGHKEAMRNLCIENTKLEPEDLKAVMAYCHDDVVETLKLFRKMLPTFTNWAQVVNRGRFAEVESNVKELGIPVDVDAIAKLTEGLPRLERSAISRAIDAGLDFWMPESGEVSQKGLAKYLVANRIPWDRTECGGLKTDRDTFKEAASARPIFQPAVDVLSIQKASHTFRGLAVGSDGRHRYYPAPFAGSTGRSQPRRNVFSLPKAFRSIIKPAEGMAIASLDWKSQEVGISAALSGDANLMKVFQADDPYLAAAMLCGMAPPHATKGSHARIRSMFKVGLLAWLYGAGEWTLGRQLGVSQIEARDISKRFARTFPQYAAWTESMRHHGIMTGELETIHGWKRGCRFDPKRADGSVNPLALSNFPVQGAGGDLMRMASVLTLRNGVDVVGTVHDAIVIESTVAEIDRAVGITQRAMAGVCERVLQMPARVDVTVAKSPDRYRDPDGQPLWLQIATEVGVE